MATDSPVRRWPWFLRGMRGIISPPALILMSAFVGFCGFAFEAGIPVGQAMFMSAAVWAMPGQLILVGAILAGASLPMAALAVSLSSMRLMPMVASLIPELRTRDTPTWLLLLLSHFVAVTAWVFTMQHIHAVPREGRVAFFAGFTLTLAAANVLLVGISYGVVSHLPPMLAGALFFLTPVYFLTSLWATARHAEVYYAMVIGLCLGPAFHLIDPVLGLLFAGVVGGTLAFMLERWLNRRRRRRGVG